MTDAVWKPALEPKLKASFISGSSECRTMGRMRTMLRAEWPLCGPVFDPVREPVRRRRAALSFLFAAGVLAATLAVSPARADRGGERDQDRARAALEAGEVLPLATVLDRVGRTVPGQVLEVELEREHGRWVYEVRVLQTGGRLVRLAVDAKSGAVLEQRARAPRQP